MGKISTIRFGRISEPRQTNPRPNKTFCKLKFLSHLTRADANASTSPPTQDRVFPHSTAVSSVRLSEFTYNLRHLHKKSDRSDKNRAKYHTLSSSATFLRPKQKFFHTSAPPTRRRKLVNIVSHKFIQRNTVFIPARRRNPTHLHKKRAFPHIAHICAHLRTVQSGVECSTRLRTLVSPKHLRVLRKPVFSHHIRKKKSNLLLQKPSKQHISRTFSLAHLSQTHQAVRTNSLARKNITTAKISPRSRLCPHSRSQHENENHTPQVELRPNRSQRLLRSVFIHPNLLFAISPQNLQDFDLLQRSILPRHPRLRRGHSTHRTKSKILQKHIPHTCIRYHTIGSARTPL
jgi:hypothetical protein